MKGESEPLEKGTGGGGTFRWQSFTAGWGAGLCNVTVTYPIHKVMFRQMLHGIGTHAAIEQLRKEGIRLLYRGMLPPLCQKTVSSAIMFGSYDTYGQYLISTLPNINDQLARSVGAGLAGINEAVLTPFERIQTLMQDKHYNSKLKSSHHAVGIIWKSHGFAEFYRGLSVIIMRNCVGNILFFGAKEKIESVLPPAQTIWSKPLTDFLTGAIIGSAVSTTYYPLNVIKTRMQSQLGGPYSSPLSVLKIVFKERGKIREMYRGVHLNYTRTLLSWGITNASYELLKGRLYKSQGKDS